MLRTGFKLISLAALALLVSLPPAAGASAADLGPAPAAAGIAVPIGLRDALSRYLSLEMIRATFDVIPRDELDARLEEEALRWGKSAPSPEAMADIDQQLLAEASYYITSLSYVVQVGGAVFPDDKAEPVYANDTIERLESLRRELFAAIEDGGEVLPILAEVERIKALTEGNVAVPEDEGLFSRHDAVLDDVLARIGNGTPA